MNVYFQSDRFSIIMIAIVELSSMHVYKYYVYIIRGLNL